MGFLLVAPLLEALIEREFSWAFGLHGVVIIGLRDLDGWMMMSGCDEI